MQKPGNKLQIMFEIFSHFYCYILFLKLNFLYFYFSEKSKTSSNSLTLPTSGISTVSGNQPVKTSSKKPTEPVNEQISRLLAASEKPKRKRKPKAPKPDSAKNGKTEKQVKQPKEVTFH